MTALTKAALDFCRECMGWVDVRDGGIGLYVYSHAERSKMLYFGDLNAVTAAVKGWCDATESAVEVSYHGYVPGEWEAQVITHASVESIVSEDLCLALLTACVQANRRLNSA